MSDEPEILDNVDMTTFFAVKQSGGSDEEALKSGRLVYKRKNNKFMAKLQKAIETVILSKIGVALGAIGLAALAYFRKELGL